MFCFRLLDVRHPANLYVNIIVRVDTASQYSLPCKGKAVYLVVCDDRMSLHITSSSACTL